MESEEDDDDTGDAPPGFNLSDLALSEDRLQMLFTIECWYEDEFVALLRQLLLALPLHAWRLGGGDDPLAEDFWQSPPLAEAPSLPPANTAKKSKESKEGKEGKAKSRAHSAPQLPLSLQQQLAALCADPEWQARRATIWQTQVYSDISRYYGGKALGVLEHFFMTGELTEKVRDLGLLTVLPYFPLQTPEALCYWTERFGFHGVFIYEHLVNLHRVPGLDVSAGLVFSDETHAVSAAVGAQGVALMSRQLIEDELREGRLVQPFGPELEGKPFFLVYPESRINDPTILAVREWIMAVPGGLCSV